MDIKERIVGSKQTSLLGLGGALLSVAAAWGWLTPEQTTGVATLLAVVGGWLKE